MWIFFYQPQLVSLAGCLKHQTGKTSNTEDQGPTLWLQTCCPWCFGNPKKKICGKIETTVLSCRFFGLTLFPPASLKDPEIREVTTSQKGAAKTTHKQLWLAGHWFATSSGESFFFRCYVDFLPNSVVAIIYQKLHRSWRLLESRAHHWHSHTTTFGRLLRPCPMWYLSKKKIKVSSKTTRDCAGPPLKKKQFIYYVPVCGVCIYTYIYTCASIRKRVYLQIQINTCIYICTYLSIASIFLSPYTRI